MDKLKKIEKVDENVQKWAKRLGAIATIIGVVTAAGAWLINQIDNSLAARIENQTNAMQQEVQSLSDKIDIQDKQTELQLTRLELMTLMDSDPENIVEIEKVAHHYFVDLQGNSFMTSLYNKYCKQYGADCEIMFK